MSDSTPYPRISIITPCLNRAGFVAEAVESVLAQDYPDVEHIIMDGGSTDGTLEALSDYPHLTVVSEPDDGLYDAVNKGIARASGEVIGLLNTDDRYAPAAFDWVARAFAGHPAADLVSGGAEVYGMRDGAERRLARYSGVREVALSWPVLTYGTPVINARFFRRALLERVGMFDLRLAISADREFLFRMRIAEAREVCIEPVLYHYRQHPGSLSITREGGAIMAKLREHLILAGRYRQEAPEALRPMFRRWHAYEAFQGVLEGVWCGDLKSALGFLREGISSGYHWPEAAVGVLYDRIVRRLGGASGVSGETR
ncbi:MAG: glycosyltransferase family 2 protein [Leptospirillia bacterium]